MPASNNVPQCIGIIMDGNRRWAKERGLPSMEGHRRGAEKIKEVIQWARELQIEHLIFYTFSNENWGRPKEEVEYLMDIFRTRIMKWAQEIHEGNGRIRFIGDRERFDLAIQEQMRDAEALTANNVGAQATFAMSYSGRAEIVRAVNALLAKGVQNVGEEEVARELFTAGIPDPDLIIRTSGEQRLSGFLPWQSVYSEFVFTKTQWPWLTREEFESIIAEYGQRDRRKGK